MFSFAKRAKLNHFSVVRLETILIRSSRFDITSEIHFQFVDSIPDLNVQTLSKKVSRVPDNMLQLLPSNDFFSLLYRSKLAESWLTFDKRSAHFEMVYGRDCYKCIASQIEQRGTQGGHSLLLGTPGTGKKYFLYYLLSDLVKKGNRVLFWCGDNLVYYDEAGSVYSIRQLPDCMEHKSFWTGLWCLIDSSPQTDLIRILSLHSKFVVSLSIGNSITSRFVNNLFPKSFYMPVWQREEYLKIHTGHVIFNVYQSRFNILGGVPGAIFSSDGPPQEDVALSSCKPEDFTRCFGYSASPPQAGNYIQTLVHIVKSIYGMREPFCIAVRCRPDPRTILTQGLPKVA
jgi:hypothetical protein